MKTPLSPLFMAIAVSIVTIGALGAQESGKSGYAAWPMWALVLFCIITVLLSALYCGMTIGLCGMDTVNLEIVANAGPEPERTYAQRIMPVRMLGHQLLCTLLIGNMLTLVLTSQLVAAMLQASELVNFIVGTLVVLIFGEIIPMSVCNSEKYALLAGSYCLPALRVSLIVLYPVAKPLGMLLDCVVGHEAGQVYDRNEFRKLIKMYCDKFSDKTGIDALQMKMIFSAMEMSEATVRDVMTPIGRTLMLSDDQTLDAAVERQLWEYGKSRLPIYHGQRENIVGVLYVRDLITASFLNLKGTNSTVTIRELLRKYPRDVLLVPSTTLLQEALTIFKSGNRQFIFVEEPSDPDEAGRRAKSEAAQGEELVPATASASHSSRGGTHKAAAKEPETRRPRVTKLHPEELERDGAAKKHNIVGIVTMEDVIEKLIASEIYDEDEFLRSDEEAAEHSDMNAGALSRPRVNLYSYGMLDETGALPPMSDEQKWALANFLANSYVLFASWRLEHVRKLLDQVGERIIRPGDGAGATELYVTGRSNTRFTLLLSGTVRVAFAAAAGGIAADMRSFSAFGETILEGTQSFVPDFTATVTAPSRLIQITRADITELERSLNAQRAKKMQDPLKLTTFSSTIRA